MPTTTNFGWSTPDNTDLVKDGALAIRTLGSAIDTSLVDLRGGTSGQILAKNSNTDMDFVWIANDQGDITAVTAGTGISGGGTTGAVTITNSMATAIDAKGDLIVGTGADTFDRLAVGGTNGHVLTVDSSTSTGLKWAAAAGGGKVLQVVSATYSTRLDVASTTYTDTGLSASITPSSTSSKVLAIVSQHTWVYRNTIEAGGRIKLVRGATDIWNQSTTTQTIHTAAGSGATEAANFITFSYLDSPSTTSSTTYKVQGRAESTANSGDISFQKGSNVSTITLMEIGA
jgi:hypothetical protein